MSVEGPLIKDDESANGEEWKRLCEQLLMMARCKCGLVTMDCMKSH